MFQMSGSIEGEPGVERLGCCFHCYMDGNLRGSRESWGGNNFFLLGTDGTSKSFGSKVHLHFGRPHRFQGPGFFLKYTQV